jgi:dTDP-4-dehydrorhamnose reductase
LRRYNEGKIYSEDDVIGPVNIYGSSKLAGEVAVLEEDPNSLVLRTTGRGLHSSTFRLIVSAFCEIGGAFRDCVRGVWQVSSSVYE